MKCIIKLLVMALLVSAATSGCTFFKKSSGSKSAPSAAAKLILTDPSYQKGYGFDVGPFALVDHLNPANLPAELRNAQTIAALRDRPAPSLIYGGQTLGLERCADSGFGHGRAVDLQRAGAALPADVSHLSEILTQTFLLDIYSNGENWFQNAIESLQESDSQEAFRPRHPIHENFVARLGEGSNPDRWVLNGIRFRLADRSVLDNFTGRDDKQQPPIAQIKINYELVQGEGIDPSLPFASFIYSLSIHGKAIDEFIYDILNIRQDARFSGCDVFRMINKYVRNDGLPSGEPSRSSFFFLHTNVLDIEANEWRLTELKPVVTDLASTISGPAGASGARKRLRIVPMKFPMFATKDDETDEVELIDMEPLDIWFSAIANDMGQSSTFIDESGLAADNANRVRRLLFKANGAEARQDHPAFRRDEVFTCAGCHVRTVGVTSDEETKKLNTIATMNKRHIGFGDGGNRPCNALLGQPRPRMSASLSTFLLESANGFALHGYSPTATGPVAPVQHAFYSGDGDPSWGYMGEERSIDAWRCLD